MANAYKILGQQNPGASNTALVTAGASEEIIISTVVIANREAAANTFRLYVLTSGGSVTDKEYIAYDAQIAANDTITLTLGVTLSNSEVLGCYGSDTNVSFNAFGTVITQEFK